MRVSWEGVVLYLEEARRKEGRKEAFQGLAEKIETEGSHVTLGKYLYGIANEKRRLNTTLSGIELARERKGLKKLKRGKYNLATKRRQLE